MSEKQSNIRIWTDAEVRYLKEHIGSQTVGEISRTLGRTENSIRIKMYKTVKCRFDEREKLIQSGIDGTILEYYGKIPVKEIASIVGLNTQAVTSRIIKLHKNGLIDRYVSVISKESKSKPNDSEPSMTTDEINGIHKERRRQLEMEVDDIEERIARCASMDDVQRLSAQRDRLMCRLKSFMYENKSKKERDDE